MAALTRRKQRASRSDAPEETPMFNYMLTYVRSLRRDTKGQDLVEYALLVALIALACVIALGSARGAIEGVFNDIATELNAQ
jgi:Flp pilus assembly pilin Flp